MLAKKVTACWQSICNAPFRTSSSDTRLREVVQRCGIVGDATWAEEDRLGTALQEIRTEIEWKQARTDWPSVGEVEERQQRKRGRGIDGCGNFARKDTSYFRAGHELDEKSQRFERLHFYGFVYVSCVVT